MPSRDDEKRMLEETDPQPGMSTFDRNWDAANGIRPVSLEERARALPRELRQRQVAVRAGDTVTANYLTLAAFLIEEMREEIERLRAERAARIVELVRNTDEFRETVTVLRRDVETLTAERDEAIRRLSERAMDDLDRLDAETRHMK